MLTQQTLEFIDSNLKFSVREYFKPDDKILLYDALIFCSITGQTKMCCSTADLNAFKLLSEMCIKMDIALADYLGCAYNYIAKYSTPGHRIGISYFLNDSVIDYCGSKLDAGNKGSLFVEQIKTDLLDTERELRSLLSEEMTYAQAFGSLLKRKKISPYFLAYKKFCSSELVPYTSPYFTTLVDILEPFFTYILAKNQIYTAHKIKTWNNSKIEDYSFCPIYFTSRYITNELSELNMGNVATDQGTAVHGIFEDILKKYVSSKTKDIVAIANRTFKSKYFLGIKDELEDHIPFVQKMFLDETSPLRTLITKDSKVLIEHQMTAGIAGTSFYGTADLIIINGTTAHILDYKTSKLDPKYLPKNNAKYTKQLSLYAVLLKELHPELTEFTATLLYTRGLVQPLTPNFEIGIERGLEIAQIKKSLTSGLIVANTGSCFLCRHPNCKSRRRPSIWAADGSRK